MDKNDFKNLGKDIRDAIKNSINSDGFQKASNNVGTTVSSALDKAFDEVRKAIESIQINTPNFKIKPTYNAYRQVNGQNPGATQTSSTAQEAKGNEKAAVANKSKVSTLPPNKPVIYRSSTSYLKPNRPMNPATFPAVPVGKVAGTLYKVFGSIGIGLFGVSAIVLIILESLSAGVSALTPIIGGLLGLLFGSVVMEMRGSNLKNRLQRFNRYLTFLNGKTSCSVKELASYCGVSERFIAKDFRKMIKCGMFPQAHINQKKSLILLNNESYQQYLALQEEERAKLTDSKSKVKYIESKDSKDPQVISILNEGKQYIDEIETAKQSIIDTEVTGKVHLMEVIISKIVDYIEEHPQQIPDVRRFMDYYLPTTIKLLNAYVEFERQPIQGENIITAKNEIKDALDTINLAFENLLDSLFESAAWDVSTDISVLQTMLAQEGLTEKNFDNKS